MTARRDDIIDAVSSPVTSDDLRAGSSGVRTVVFVGLCALLIFGPLALGGVEDWSIALIEMSAAILLCIWLVAEIARGEMNVEWNPLFAPMLAMGAVGVAQLVSGHTAYRNDTVSELWLYGAYGLVALLAVQVLSNSLLVRFARIMAIFGGAYALFAVLQEFTAGGRMYWTGAAFNWNSYGSYINHNHYAGLIELLIPFPLVLALRGFRRAGAGIWLLRLVAAVLMAASVVLSQSRGGMFALGVELLFLAVVWVRQFSLRKAAAGAVALAAVTAMLLARIAPEQAVSRITDSHDPARLLIWRDSVRMFLAHPIAGSGLGTFANAFPHYRVFFDGFFVNHAHNDYAELALDTGIVGLGIAIWFLVVLYREGFRNVRRARMSEPALISTAALTGCTGLLAHSFLDFNLNVPANAVLFFVLCAAATAKSSQQRSGFSDDETRRSSDSEYAAGKLSRER
jgi:O-antigen ligase